MRRLDEEMVKQSQGHPFALRLCRPYAASRFQSTSFAQTIYSQLRKFVKLCLQVVLTPRENEVSQQLFALIAHQRQGNGVYQPLLLVRQGEPREALFYQGFVEDRGPGGVSYVDWLSTLHRQVQQKA
jgi:hypothetical protein